MTTFLAAQARRICYGSGRRWHFEPLNVDGTIKCAHCGQHVHLVETSRGTFIEEHRAMGGS